MTLVPPTQGFGTSLLGLPLGPMYISTLEMCRSHYLGWESRFIGMPPDIASGVVASAAGASAAAFAQLLGVPIDIVSQHRMLQQGAQPVKQESPYSILRRVVRAEGMRGLYRGYHISVMTYAPSSALMWGCHAVYSDVMDACLPHFHGSDVPPPDGSAVDPWDDPALVRDLTIAAAAGAAAGVTTAFVTNPMDVLRARLQTDVRKGNVRSVIRELQKQYGRLAWFTRGASARAMAMGPTSAIVMTMYQVLKRMAMRRPGDGDGATAVRAEWQAQRRQESASP